MTEAEAKEAYYEALGEHESFHDDRPELSCPWCHDQDPSWQDFLGDTIEEDV